jgi:hypothetical protein
VNFADGLEGMKEANVVSVDDKLGESVESESPLG